MPFVGLKVYSGELAFSVSSTDSALCTVTWISIHRGIIVHGNFGVRGYYGILIVIVVRKLTTASISLLNSNFSVVESALSSNDFTGTTKIASNDSPEDCTSWRGTKLFRALLWYKNKRGGGGGRVPPRDPRQQLMCGIQRGGKSEVDNFARFTRSYLVDFGIGTLQSSSYFLYFLKRHSVRENYKKILTGDS